MFQFSARLFTALLSAALVSSTALAVPRKTDVVIVGAGLSGLTAAHELKGRGLSYHLLELAPIIGGRIKTVEYSRQDVQVSADAGMEEYWESNPAVSLIRKLKLPIRTDPAVSSIVIGGKLYSLGNRNPTHHLHEIFDGEELSALTRFNQQVATLIQGMTPGAGIPPDKQPLVHKSFADWVREQKLGNKVEEWIRITLECEIGTGWDRISALDGISEFHIFLGEGETSYRVAGGNVKFINALANDVGRNNISVNKRVIRIAHKDGRSRVTFLASDTNRNEEIEARHVILTVPLYRLMEIQFEPELSRAKREAIVSMTWGSYFKVHVLVPKTSEQFWTASLPLLSDSDLGVIYDGNPDQPAGKDSLRVLSLLIGGDRAERLNFTPLDQARAEMKAAFDKLWPGFSKTIVDMEFYRYHPRAIASWPVGRSRFDLQSDEIRKPENRVYLAGDHTESSHSDGAVNSAARAVAQILQAEGMKPGESLGAKHKKSRKNLSKLINGKKQEGRKHEPVTKKL